MKQFTDTRVMIIIFFEAVYIMDLGYYANC